MINKVFLIGNLGKDVEVRSTQNGTEVATFSLATSSSFKDKDDQWQNKTTWHNIVAWKPSTFVQGLKKGQMVHIQGSIENRSYEKDGVTKYISEIVADTVRLLEKVEVKEAPTRAEQLGDDLPF